MKGSPQSIIVKLLSTCDNGVIIYLKDKNFTGGMEYTLKASGDLNSAYGVELNDGLGDNIMFSAKDTDNEDFKVTETSLMDNRTLQLVFNEDINPTLAQQIFNYYITDQSGNPIQIKKAAIGVDGENEGKSVRLSIAGTFDKTKNYEVLINNLNDITRQDYITESKYQFSGVYPDKTDMAIDFAWESDKGTVVVYFNKPINEATATAKEYYTITGVTDGGFSATPVKVFYDNANPSTVKLYLANEKVLSSSKMYKVRVASTMQDYLGSTASKVCEYSFKGSGDESLTPSIDEAVIISKDTIRVKLNKEVGLEAPNIVPSNYCLEYKEEGATITKMPISVGYFNATTLTLKFDNLNFQDTYTLNFDSLKDYAGTNITTTSGDEKSVVVKLGE